MATLDACVGRNHPADPGVILTACAGHNDHPADRGHVNAVPVALTGTLGACAGRDRAGHGLRAEVQAGARGRRARESHGRPALAHSLHRVRA